MKPTPVSFKGKLLLDCVRPTLIVQGPSHIAEAEPPVIQNGSPIIEDRPQLTENVI